MDDLMKTMREQKRKAREVIASWPEGKQAVLQAPAENEPKRYLFTYVF